MITISHLGRSRSERTVWLMEELGLPYELEWHEREGNREYIAGGRFTAADVMMQFPFGTMQLFLECDLAPYGNLAAWQRRLQARPAFARAMAIAGPGAGAPR